MRVFLLQGDSFHRLQEMEADSIDAVICDPPYGLEFLQAKEWDKLGRGRADLAAGLTKGGSDRFKNSPPLPSFGRGGAQNRLCKKCGGSERGRDRKGFHRCRCEEPGFPPRLLSNKAVGHGILAFHLPWVQLALSVLKPGGRLITFSGGRTFHRLSQAMVGSGFVNVRLDAWVYANGFPKNLNVAKSIEALLETGRSGSLKTGDGSRDRGGFHGSAFPRSRRVPDMWEPTTGEGQKWNGWGTSLKPAWEPVLTGMKPTFRS